MMRYLQHDTLQAAGLEAFDSWVSVFGKPATEYELAPAGNKWRMKTRIASYSNLPELISMFKQCADVKTADTLQLKVPDCELHIVETEATPFQQELVAELSDRADDVQAGAVPPEEDNMLRITGDGRKVGLDPRLIKTIERSTDVVPEMPSIRVSDMVDTIVMQNKATLTDELHSMPSIEVAEKTQATLQTQPHPEQAEAHPQKAFSTSDFCGINRIDFFAFETQNLHGVLGGFSPLTSSRFFSKIVVCPTNRNACYS